MIIIEFKKSGNFRNGLCSSKRALEKEELRMKITKATGSYKDLEHLSEFKLI